MTFDAGTSSPTWVFIRHQDTIRVRRRSAHELDVTSDTGESRTFAFVDANELAAFQCGFERHLVDTGWSLIELTRPADDTADALVRRADVARVSDVG